eukprot:724453-Prorocentrum_minimum.AAC.1
MVELQRHAERKEERSERRPSFIKMRRPSLKRRLKAEEATKNARKVLVQAMRDSYRELAMLQRFCVLNTMAGAEMIIITNYIN